jgi:hypothetical protein
MSIARQFQLPPEYRVAIAVATGADLLAYALMVHSSREEYFCVALGLNVVGLFLFSVLTGSLLKWKERSSTYILAKEGVSTIASLPLAEAKDRALALLSHAHLFRCRPQTANANPLTVKLGPTLKDFFLLYESVEEINGDFRVGHQWIDYSSVRPGFLRIGFQYDGSELVVPPGEDWVFMVHDAEHILDGLPSIYHHILLLE